MSRAADLIDAYLDDLAGELRVAPRRLRRILIEVEDHLREAAGRAEADGVTPEQAQQAAIAVFGAPRVVARRFAAEENRLPAPAVLLQLTLALALLAGAGLTAVGVSGALAAGLGGVFGKSFISGDPPGVTYTAERCEYLLLGYPAAHDCNAAATAHHFEEVVGYRAAAGVLGLLILGGSWAARRRFGGTAGDRALPDGFSAIVGAALFGVAALGLLGMSLMQIAFGVSSGAGGLLSGGIVAGLAFLLYVRRFLKSLVQHSVPP